MKFLDYVELNLLKFVLWFGIRYEQIFDTALGPMCLR
jgi:hypothetical protein